MFEVYTEKARRCVFFARYEAASSGAMEISLEHFLLALLREAPGLVEAWAPGVTEAETRSRIPKVEPTSDFVPEAEELPLSAAVRRALSLADDESAKLEHEYIGCKHILLGISQVKGTVAARILAEHGFDLEEAREDAARSAVVPDEEERVLYSLQPVAWIKGFHWEKQPCRPRDALISADDQRHFLYRGQPYNPTHFVLARKAWTFFHCAICWSDLYPVEGTPREDCYTNGLDWLCVSCYERMRGHPEDPIYDGDY